MTDKFQSSETSNKLFGNNDFENFEINIGFIALIEQSVLIQSSQSTANSEMSSSEYG